MCEVTLGVLKFSEKEYFALVCFNSVSGSSVVFFFCTAGSSSFYVLCSSRIKRVLG